MNKFYTVDRKGSLSTGTVIELTKYDDVNPKVLQEHVDSLFSNGVSSHGENYLLKNGSHGQISSSAIELLFEYVRRANFPEIPSRFECSFACETIDEAVKFRAAFGNPTDPIYEVFSENSFFKGNMALLDNDQTSLVCSYFADEYWKGNQGPRPSCFWEVLLQLPVTIGDQVS
ncbi:DUF2441 domain-containing protein [Photobacterium ganghwense]|uniref:DUF2441 domain-containing protein n=1 Tax=Photobacterium ganghwense TaxID=320778 RepID=UPI001C2CDB52|nr:DUF2441 domain-containing protein [Photobacterium ganghwense]MBV1839302.1 DUF2441 domain-containing protein [Photobacterium ganghwense]